MLDGLMAALDETSIPFVLMAWDHAPDDLYGVETLNDQTALSTDANAASETMLEGYIDVFTRTADYDEKQEVEDCLRGLGIWFALESVQYEDDTKYIHLEWRWRDTNGSAI